MYARRVPKGSLGIAMPALRTGDVGRKLQGGLPPEPYRGRNDWGSANLRAMSDGVSKACQNECFHSTSEWHVSQRRDGTLAGRWVAP
jgi:hypothetical protein